MRKLASIRRCTAIQDIPKADFIDMATVDGWKCVVGKGTVVPGDLGVYYEIDSFLPAEDPRYSKMSTGFREFEGKLGLKIATKRFKKQISQGLFLPLALFPELSDAVLGEDVTEQLGVVKWEIPIPSEMLEFVSGYTSPMIPNTELDRVQNLDDVFAHCGEVEFEKSTKLNGMAVTMYQLEKFGVCSKKYDFLDLPGCLPWELARKHNVEDALAAIGGKFAVQGELIGSWVGQNGERVPNGETEFHVFNIYDLAQGTPLLPDDRLKFMAKLSEYGCTLPHTPVAADYRKLKDYACNLDALLGLAVGPTQLYPGGKLEGLVFNARHSDLRFKVISNEHLLDESK